MGKNENLFPKVPSKASLFLIFSDWVTGVFLSQLLWHRRLLCSDWLSLSHMPIPAPRDRVNTISERLGERCGLQRVTIIPYYFRREVTWYWVTETLDVYHSRQHVQVILIYIKIWMGAFSWKMGTSGNSWLYSCIEINNLLGLRTGWPL